MKKFTLAIVAFAAMVLASCGGSKPQQEVADQDTTKTFEQAQLEASVKMHLDSLSTQINEKQFAAIEENIKAGKIKLSAAMTRLFLSSSQKSMILQSRRLTRLRQRLRRIRFSTRKWKLRDVSTSTGL